MSHGKTAVTSACTYTLPVATLSRGDLAPGVAFAGGARAERAVVDRVDAELHVDVEAVRRHAEDLIEERLALQRVVLRNAAAEDPDRHLLLERAEAVVLHRAHLEDVVVDVDLELEVVAEQALELHDVEEDRSVLHGADEDRNAVLVGGREERRLFTPSASSISCDALAEQVVQLGRRHRASGTRAPGGSRRRACRSRGASPPRSRGRRCG